MSTKEENREQMLIAASKGGYARVRGDHDAAVEHWNKAADLAKSLGDEKAQAAFLFEVGVAYSGLDDPQSAINYHKRALDLLRKQDNPDNDEIVSYLFSLALDHEQAKQFDRCRAYGHEAYAVGENTKTFPKILFLLARLSESDGDIDQAIDFFEKAARAVENRGYNAKEAEDEIARLKRESADVSEDDYNKLRSLTPSNLSAVPLSDIFRAGEAVVFAGAGISIPPPAGLPDWNTLRDELIRACAAGDPDLLKHLPRLTSAPMLHGVESKGLIPELVMSKIEAVQPNYATIFEALKKGQPNANHHYLAQIAATGYCRIIVTTNFDTFIERALDEAGVNYQTFIDPIEDYAYYSPALPLPDSAYNKQKNSFAGGLKPGQKRVQLLKIHGCITQPGSITATVERESSGLSPHIRRALLQLLPDHVIVFWGYSGADLKVDLDYLGMATLNNVARGFIWSFHATDGWKEEPSPYVRELSSIFGERFKVGHNLLPSAFDELLPEKSRPTPVDLTDEDYDKWRREKAHILTETLSSWSSKELSASSGALIYGSLLSFTGDLSEARSVYERSFSSGDKVERLKAAVSLGTLALQVGDTETAMNWFTNLPGKPDKQHLEDWLACLLGQAEVYLRQGKIEMAGRALDQGITIAQHNKLKPTQVQFQTCLAKAFVKWGRYVQARGLYENILEVMRVNGLENERSATLLDYADLLFRQGDSKAALAQAESVVRIAKMLGNTRIVRRARLVCHRFGGAVLDSMLDTLSAEADAAGDIAMLCNIAMFRAEKAAGRDDRAAARKIWDEALEFSEPLAHEFGQIHGSRGRWEMKWGAYEAAANEFAAAYAACLSVGAIVDAAGVYELLGYLYRDYLGKPDRASECFEEAFVALRRAHADKKRLDLAFLAATTRRSGHDDASTAWEDFRAGIDDRLIQKLELPTVDEDAATNRGLLFFGVLNSAIAEDTNENHQTAVELFDNALILADRLGSDWLRLEVLIRRAHSYRSLGTVDQAMADYRAARDLAVKSPEHLDQSSLGICFHGMGWCYASSKDIERAIMTWDQAIDITRSQHLLSRLVKYAYPLGSVLANIRPHDSIRFLQQARFAAERLRNDKQLADIYRAWSTAMANTQGGHDKTIRGYESAALLYRDEGNFGEAIECLRAAADVALAMSMWSRAMKLLEHTVAVLLLTDEPSAHPVYDGVLADLARVDTEDTSATALSPVLLRLKATEAGKAMYFLELAAQRVKMPDEIKDSARVGRILEYHQDNWGRAMYFVYETAFQETGDVKILEMGMRYAEVYLDEAATLTVLERLAPAYAEAGYDRDALIVYRRAAGLAAEVDDQVTQLRILMALGGFCLTRGEADTARQVFRQAHSVAVQLGDGGALRSVAEALENLEK